MSGILLASFQIIDKFKRVYFFQETFLLVTIGINIILEKTFFTLNNANTVFINQKLT